MTFEIEAAAVAAGQQFGMARLDNGKLALRAKQILVHVIGRPADFIVGTLKQLRERQLDVVAHTVDFRQTILARLLKERRQRLFVKPACHFGKRSRRPRYGRRFGRREVSEQTRFAKLRFGTFGDLAHEEPLVDDLAQTVDDARPIEIDARRLLVLERMEGGPPDSMIASARPCVCRRIASNSGVSGRHQFQLLGLRRLPIGGTPGVAIGEGRKLPVGIPVIAAQGHGSSGHRFQR